MIKHDVIIVGNSYTGLSLALILAKSGINIAIIAKEVGKNSKINKNHHLDNNQIDSKQGSRLFALNHYSCNFLLKEVLSEKYHSILMNSGQPINRIRVVDGESTNKVDFFPEKIGLNDFGIMIDEIKLKKILEENIYDLQKQGKIFIYENEFFDNSIIECPTQSFDYLNPKINIELKSNSKLENTKILTTYLLIGADGRNSSVKKAFAIESIRKNYDQTAIVCDIEHKDWHHQGIAIEKFRPCGPFAILPKFGGYQSSLVWTESHQSAIALQSISSEEISCILHNILNEYLGFVKIVSKIELYSLSYTITKKIIGKRMALIGDAAHSLHPVAGQGVNLGLRDVHCLAKLIKQNHMLGLDIGSIGVLIKYQEQRIVDVLLLGNVTDLIVNLFSNDLSILKLIRGLGMNFFNKSDFTKNIFSSYACGKIII